MLRTVTLFFIFTAFVSSFSIAGARADYEISFENPHSHYAEVKMDISGVATDSFEVIMPVWIPGSYMVREFSRHVEGFLVKDGSDKPLKFRKTRKNAWMVYNNRENVMVFYKVYAYELSVRTCYIDIDQAYINGTGMFMYTEATRSQPSTITIKPWKDWKIASSGLPATKRNQWVRSASDYDRIADSPIIIGNHDTINFISGGIPHQVAMVGKANYDREKIRKDFKAIVDSTTAIFRENPNPDYLFIIHNHSSGGGGLEHLNSTSIITSRTSYEDDKGYHGLLSLVAHEYFHLWIVKRVRPLELGPFDYENEVYTRQLWFFEGFTSYYDDYLVHRAGFTSAADYLQIVKNTISGLANTPGDKVQPVAESSFDAWIKYYRQNENSRNSIVSYYTKGSLIAMMLNLEIMHSTNGERSLDDLMHYLYHEHYKKKNHGLTDEELMAAFSHIAGKDLTSFFEKHIYNTVTIPVEQYLAYAGLVLTRIDGKKTARGYSGISFSSSATKNIVTGVERNSPAWNQGVYVNDEIIEADRKNQNEVKDYLSNLDPGKKVKLKIIRAGLEREVEIELSEPVAHEYMLEPARKPTALQEKIRNKWLR